MMMKGNWIVEILSEFKVLCYLKDSKNKLEIYSVWIFLFLGKGKKYSPRRMLHCIDSPTIDLLGQKTRSITSNNFPTYFFLCLS